MSAVAATLPLRYQTREVGELGALMAPPYDVIAPAEASELRARHEHNVVRLILPQGEGDERYRRAASTLQSWIDSGVLVKEDRPVVYAHRHAFKAAGVEHQRTGLWALLRLSPFAARVVLPHEMTMGGPRADRLALMRACRAQLSPIFVISSDPDGGLSETFQSLTARAADEHAEFPAGQRHEIWRIEEGAALDELGRRFEDRTFLIADGHHRYETALNYRRELVSHGAPETGDAGHEFVLAHIVPENDPGLLLQATHRVIMGGRLDWPGAIARLRGRFAIERLEETELADEIGGLDRESQRSTFILITRDEPKAWRLRLALDEGGPEPDIAAVALHELLLAEGIGLSLDEQLPRTEYLRDSQEAMARVRSGEAEAAAILAAPRVSEVRKAAEAGRRLPAKTTFFWPKVPVGIAIHPVDPGVRVRLL
jgi:uncharacterized protein (DUF1015 family)